MRTVQVVTLAAVVVVMERGVGTVPVAAAAVAVVMERGDKNGVSGGGGGGDSGGGELV